MMDQVALPPNNEEIHIQLPSIIHSRQYFVRPLIQFDYDVFLAFTQSLLYRKYFQQVTDTNKAFIEVINSYKSTNPFLMLAINGRESFKVVGLLSIVFYQQQLLIVSYCEVEDAELKEIVIKYCTSFGFDQIRYVSSQEVDQSGFWNGASKVQPG